MLHLCVVVVVVVVVVAVLLGNWGRGVVVVVVRLGWDGPSLCRALCFRADVIVYGSLLITSSSLALRDVNNMTAPVQLGDCNTGMIFDSQFNGESPSCL